MIRIKRGFVASNRRKKILKLNRGSRFSYSSLFRLANQNFLKRTSFSYKERKKRKRVFRNLWIHRVNSILRLYGFLSFNQFFYLCRKNKIQLNRKLVSQLTIYDPESFLNELKSSLI